MADNDGTDDLTATLASGVHDRGVGLAYGSPISLGTTSIVPVAFVTYGFGGAEDSSQWGTAGGGGGVSFPLGAYVETPGGARFRANTIALLSLAIPLVGTIGWALSSVLKRTR